jgi:thiol:disulfide interchange protein
MDSSKFTVDFNDPLAGKELTIDAQLVSLLKAENFADKNINWIESYDDGLKAIEEQNKPAVLFLYADWCGYCKKMKTETLGDPRVTMMSDDFIWIKVNSDEQSEIKQFYEQKSFPLTVVIDNSGEVIEKISGYKPAGEFQTELQKILNFTGNSTLTFQERDANDAEGGVKLKM